MCLCVFVLSVWFEAAYLSSSDKKETIIASQGAQGRSGPEGKQGMKGEKVMSFYSGVICCVHTA